MYNTFGLLQAQRCFEIKIFEHCCIQLDSIGELLQQRKLLHRISNLKDDVCVCYMLNTNGKEYSSRSGSKVSFYKSTCTYKRSQSI